MRRTAICLLFALLVSTGEARGQAWMYERLRDTSGGSPGGIVDFLREEMRAAIGEPAPEFEFRQVGSQDFWTLKHFAGHVREVWIGPKMFDALEEIASPYVGASHPYLEEGDRRRNGYAVVPLKEKPAPASSPPPRRRLARDLRRILISAQQERRSSHVWYRLGRRREDRERRLEPEPERSSMKEMAAASMRL